MSNPSNQAEVVRILVESQSPVKITIAGESFTTKVFSVDSVKKVMICDELLPKYGNELLVKSESYELSQKSFDSGMICDITCRAEYMRTERIHHLPVNIFAFPVEINSQSSYYSSEPKKLENVVVYFNLPKESYSIKVNRLSIRNLEFRSGAEITLPEKEHKLSFVRLALPDNEAAFSGIIREEAKYTYRIDYSELDAKNFQRISKYLSDRYKEELGSKNIADEKAEIRIPGLLIKPVLQAEHLKGKIFIVDDELLITELLANIFKKSGYHTQVCNNGVEALERAAVYQPDVILLDIRMPEYDGFTICRRLKRDPRTKNIPVIMVSGARNKEDVIEAKEAGAIYYFIKSADMDFTALIKKIEEIISSR